MADAKFIEPLFDTQYFKQLFFSKINQHVQTELSSVINDWIMINLYNPTQEYHETQTGSEFGWTNDYHCMDKQVFTSVLHMAQDGTILFEDGYKNIPVHIFDHDSIADNSYYYDQCKNKKFKYLWYSIHKGPHELPMHVDKDSPIRYVQVIHKNSNHTDWTYNGKELRLKEGDAFLFDPKFTHSIITKRSCESIFLIADCIEETIDKFNV